LRRSAGSGADWAGHRPAVSPALGAAQAGPGAGGRALRHSAAFTGIIIRCRM